MPKQKAKARRSATQTPRNRMGKDAGGTDVAFEHPENSDTPTADQTKLVQIA